MNTNRNHIQLYIYSTITSHLIHGQIILSANYYFKWHHKAQTCLYVSPIVAIPHSITICHYDYIVVGIHWKTTMKMKTLQRYCAPTNWLLIWLVLHLQSFAEAQNPSVCFRRLNDGSWECDCQNSETVRILELNKWSDKYNFDSVF